MLDPAAYSALLVRSTARAHYSGTATGSRIFLDFVIDDQSLYSLVLAHGLDQITALWIAPRLKPDAEVQVLQLLAGNVPGDTLSGRTSIYVCPMCADLGCGAITARVEVGLSVVLWHSWLYENNYDPTMSYEIDFMPEVTFDRRQYLAALLWAGQWISGQSPKREEVGVTGP